MPVRGITYDMKRIEAGIVRVMWNPPGGYVHYYLVECVPYNGQSTPQCPFINSVMPG